MGPYGGPGGAIDTQMNPASMFKDRFTNINTAKVQIEKQRERDAAREQLIQEFNVIDINQDGKLTFEELYNFL